MKAFVVHSKVFAIYFKTKELAEKWIVNAGLNVASVYPTISEIEIIEEYNERI